MNGAAPDKNDPVPPALISSPRERRLWLLAGIVVAGIYGTLSQVRVLAGFLRDQGLITNLFFLGMILIGAAVVVQGLRRKPSGAEIGVWLGIAGAYLISFLRMRTPEERSHMIEYSVVALLIHEALKERVVQGRGVPNPALLAIAAATLVGMFDEVIQIFLPTRVFDWFDVTFNFIAALIAVVGSVMLAWVRGFADKKGGM